MLDCLKEKYACCGLSMPSACFIHEQIITIEYILKGNQLNIKFYDIDSCDCIRKYFSA